MPEEECGGISLISPGSIGLRFIRAGCSLQEKHPGLAIRHRFAPMQVLRPTLRG
ncbi:hypothetical protein [Sinorhizobium meliloti]|uniref:hypothetical protein n=1 Tax=Rhizobium meliloti TaxID=382 RepID=UPI0013E33083|nr:hypothetical protein [Sinorhizobium meliloti]